MDSSLYGSRDLTDGLSLAQCSFAALYSQQLVSQLMRVSKDNFTLNPVECVNCLLNSLPHKINMMVI